jgi:hypothetical protein
MARRPIKGRQLKTSGLQPSPPEPTMNARQTRTAHRVAALFAAVTTTTLIFASQLGLAGHYTGEADAAVIAAKRAAPVALNASSAAPQLQQRSRARTAA